ncbi:sulfhydryl oxidase 1-like [Achroia grisella]|uniref:sulfhydryl oxidase 1-like n=1 Tax=Achroia grisella TaxID=688607 RepID=UPI0027D29107|nr:sulfhydryl oxidase 1-like [Achroia grisella]
MYSWYFIVIVVISQALVNCAIIANDDVEEQGLYSKSDNVVILTQRNFERKVYNQRHAAVVQFYNSYCGHCRAFAPKFKAMAKEFVPWKPIIQLAVMDCSVEENIEICRQFEVMAYPSLRYVHEQYKKANGNVGDRIQMAEAGDKLKAQVIMKMQNEQSKGRLGFAPKLGIGSYASYASALTDVPNDVTYTFLIFENENSTIGSEIALDINDYQHIKVKRIYENSELADIAGVHHFPGLVAVRSTLEATNITPKNPTQHNVLNAINTFLKSKNYIFPTRDITHKDNTVLDHSNEKHLPNSDVVYYADLEKTLKTSLTTEITRHKILKGELLTSLLDYLEILRSFFPARGNLRDYIIDLHTTLGSKQEWSGSEVYETVKKLENTHAPVYSSELEYIGCKGSQPQYRGYTCGLWTMFHTLTVNAAQSPGVEGPKVLKVMHGYVKNFFGCTDCSEHFQAMATRNRIFDIKENDKAVLWLWIAHNEVNLRLAGDLTEDPEHPKTQFPSVTNCPECRSARGAWNLPSVYQYLIKVYKKENIWDLRRARSIAAAPSPFSNLDIGMLSLLYMSA